MLVRLFGAAWPTTLAIFLLTISLIMHGLANLGGFFASWAANDLGFRPEGWLLPGRAGIRSPAGRLASPIWLISSGLLIWAGVSLFGMNEAWRAAAVAGCAVSLVVIGLWWRAVPPGARFGAIYDAILLGVLLSPLSVQIPA